MQCERVRSGICVWGVGNSDICDGVSADQGPICPLPEPSRKTEKATCLTEREEAPDLFLMLLITATISINTTTSTTTINLHA